MCIELEQRIISNMSLRFKKNFETLTKLEQENIYQQMKIIFDYEIRPIMISYEQIILDLELKQLNK